MALKKSTAGIPAQPIPSGPPPSGPEPLRVLRRGHDPGAREREFQLMLRGILAAIFYREQGRNRPEYRALRRMGASPLEAMEAILSVSPDRESRTALMAIYLPHGISITSMRSLLKRYNLDPACVAAEFFDQRRARSFLRRLGLGDV